MKTFFHSRYGLVFAATVVAALALGSSMNAAAQSSDATQIPYAKSVTCYSATTNECKALFPAVPANTRLVVQYIASSVSTPTQLLDAEFDVGGEAFISILHTLQSTDSTGNKIYVASQPMLYYWSAGEKPYFVMNAEAGSFEFMSGQVTLTGYLVALK